MLAEEFPAFSAENAIYNDERIKSAELPHRRLHLEALAVLLQRGPADDHRQERERSTNDNYRIEKQEP